MNHTNIWAEGCVLPSKYQEDVQILVFEAGVSKRPGPGTDPRSRTVHYGIEQKCNEK